MIVCHNCGFVNNEKRDEIICTKEMCNENYVLNVGGKKFYPGETIFPNDVVQRFNIIASHRTKWKKDGTFETTFNEDEFGNPIMKAEVQKMPCKRCGHDLTNHPEQLRQWLNKNPVEEGNNG